MKLARPVIASTISIFLFIGTSPGRTTIGYATESERQAAVLRALQHLTSTGVLSEIVRTHGLVQRFQAKSEEDAVGQLRNMIDIVEDNEAGTLDIGVFSGDAVWNETLAAAVEESVATIPPADPDALAKTPPEKLRELLNQQEEEVEAARVVMLDLMVKQQFADLQASPIGEVAGAVGSKPDAGEIPRAVRRFEQKYSILNFTRESIIRAGAGDASTGFAPDKPISRQISDAPSNLPKSLRSMPAKFPAKAGEPPALSGSAPAVVTAKTRTFPLWVIILAVGLLALVCLICGRSTRRLP